MDRTPRTHPQLLRVHGAELLPCKFRETYTPTRLSPLGSNAEIILSNLHGHYNYPIYYVLGKPNIYHNDKVKSYTG